MRQEVGRFVEQAVPQTRTDENTEEAIEEEGIELLLRNALSAIEPIDHKVGRNQSQHPAERIPTHGNRAELKSDKVRIPSNHK